MRGVRIPAFGMRVLLLFLFVVGTLSQVAADVVKPQKQGGGRSFPFGQYAAGPVYRGKARMPQFNGRDRSFAKYRTALREGLREGVNFAGRYSLIQAGCGSGCMHVFLGDVITGRISRFPLGGADNGFITLFHKKDSRLVVVFWSDGKTCFEQRLVLGAKGFKTISRRKAGDLDACMAITP